MLRQEQGEAPPLEEYLQRFPQFALQLKPLFEVHQALETSLTFDREQPKVLDTVLSQTAAPV